MFMKLINQLISRTDLVEGDYVLTPNLHSAEVYFVRRSKKTGKIEVGVRLLSTNGWSTYDADQLIRIGWKDVQIHSKGL